MGRLYTEMNWVTYKAENREVIGCQERDDGGMTPIQKVGTYQLIEGGRVTAKILLDGVQIRVTGNSFKDLTWNLADVLVKHYQEQVRCSPCHGSGLFAKATWEDPQIPCDECQGTGENNPEVEEIPEDEDGPLVDCRNCRGVFPSRETDNNGNVRVVEIDGVDFHFHCLRCLRIRNGKLHLPGQ